MKKTSLLFVLVLAIGYCFAQDGLPSVVADRPGFIWGVEVAPHRTLTWNNGFTFEAFPDGTQWLTLNSTTMQYGLFENVEVRVGTDFVLFDDDETAERRFGCGPLAVGAKVKLYESANFLPSVGILAELRLPRIGTEALLPPHVAPSLYLLFEHSIGERFWLIYNAGFEWDGATPEPQAFLALGFGADLAEGLGVYVETINYLHSEEQSQHLTELGLTWLVSRRVQLDIEADMDFRNFGKHYGVGAGVSWLIN